MGCPHAACAMALLRVGAKTVLVGAGRSSVTRAIRKAREGADVAIPWIRERNLSG